MFRDWADAANKWQDVTLKIVIMPEAGETPKEGVTEVTEIDGETDLDATRDQGWWREKLAARNVTVSVTIFPHTSSSAGDVKGSLLHELVLHAIPMLGSVAAIKVHGSAEPADPQLGIELLAHAKNVMAGEDAQHADYPQWVRYVDVAVALGNADKEKGLSEGKSELVGEGSDVILSAVNDAQSHAERESEMPLEARNALFKYANEIGEAEEQFQAEHPDVFVPEDDEMVLEEGSSVPRAFDDEMVG